MSRIPKGVTVRKPGERRSPRALRKNSLLWRMANQPRVEVVVETMCATLGIPTDSPLINVHLDAGEPRLWRARPAWKRLENLADWLRGECFELMDLVDVGPVSTLGD